jgi:hypothetical protein
MGISRLCQTGLTQLVCTRASFFSVAFIASRTLLAFPAAAQQQPHFGSVHANLDFPHLRHLVRLQTATNPCFNASGHAEL